LARSLADCPVHIVGGVESPAAKTNAVENIIPGIAVAQYQLAFEWDHGALRPGTNILPAAVPLSVVLRVTPCAIIA
jgi:hypothetical protein